MNDYLSENLALLAWPTGGSEGGAQTALVSAEHAFDLPALTVHSIEKPAFHLATIFFLGPLSGGSASLRRDKTVCAELLADEHVDVFRIVSCIKNRSSEGYTLRGISKDSRRLASIAAGTDGYFCRKKKMRSAVACGRKLRPASHLEPRAAPEGVVRRNVAGLKAGRVSRDLRPFLNQAAFACKADRLVKKPVKAPFFRRRASAFWRAV